MSTPQPTTRELLSVFAKLGWLAFGGPVAQIGLMHLELVERRRWISEEDFVDALNFCHVLPGPEALQLAIFLGWKTRGVLGGLATGLLFLFPGALTLTLLGWLYVEHGRRPEIAGVLWGFRPVGLALLVAAMIRIARASLKTRLQWVLSVAAFVAFQFLSMPFIAVLLVSGLLHALVQTRKTAPPAPAVVLAAPLVGAAVTAPPELGARLVDIAWFFTRVGLFSFGGAYAVLPMLREGAVATYGWLSDAQMIDALALGETTPGPLISLGIFIGYLAGAQAGSGLAGALVSTVGLFTPSFVFVLAFARVLQPLTRKPGVKPFLQGVTAAVVGLMTAASLVLAAAACQVDGHVDPLTIALALAALVLVTRWKARWNVVVAVLAGGVLGLLRVLIAS